MLTHSLLSQLSLSNNARHTNLISIFLGTEVEPMLIITENAYEKLVKVTRFKLEEDESFLVDEEEDENNV